MNRVAISGYYGFHNAGDEAVLYSIIGVLKELRPHLQVVVLSHEPRQTEKAYGVEAVNRWKPWPVLRALKQSDLLISGGGSLLQDVTGLKSLLYYLAIIWCARLLGKKVMLYAQGIGPITTYCGRRILPKVLNGVDVISVRDEHSKGLLRGLGVTRPPVYVTVDPVLGISRETVDLAAGEVLLAQSGVQLAVQRPLVGVSVRHWRHLAGYKEVLARVCDELVDQGWQVVFLPFHFPDDIGPSRDVMRQMRNQAAIVKQQLLPREMLAAVGLTDLILGMRLHSLIMAAVMHVPMVGISYDPKVDAFLKLVKQPVAGKVETLDFGELWKEVEQVINNRKEIARRLAVQARDLAEEARSSARLAMELLEQSVWNKFQR